MLPGQISPDGLWVWDGTGWLPTTSPDGRWRWDGFRWAALPPPDPMPHPRNAATLRVAVLASALVVLVGVLAGSAIAVGGTHDRSVDTAGSDLPAPTDLSAPGEAPGYPGAPTGTQVYTVPARNHTTKHVDYPQTPPVGGVHAPIWLNCGVYDKPVPAENAVHSMEHGVVWITYDPARVDAAGVAALRDMVTAHYAGGERMVILSPYPGLPRPVVASAWGVQLRVLSANDPRLGAFVDYFRNGPQTPEHGARCSGGVGTPLDGGAGGVVA